jgi:6-pyruvoyltetrahydropterin/6-carboxytetrahydropterin synthase
VYELRVTGDFSSAHFLKDYRGACSSVHGHNWKVEAIYRGKKLNDQGMVEDLRVLRKALDEVLAELDHAYLNELPHFAQQNPSSENIAQFIYKRLQQYPVADHCELAGVKVAESDTTSVCYYGDS